MQYIIAKEQDGMSIRAFLHTYLKPSSKMLKYLKYRPNGICVNGETRTVRYILRAGDCLELAVCDTEDSEKILPVDLPIEILYEDSELVVPSKPAQMPTHPSHGHYDDTVANALAFRYASRNVPFVFRPINRLDRNTSGLLLVAKNKLSAGRLTRFLENGEIQKRYLAVLDGELQSDGGMIDACLHRTAESIIVREVCSPDTPDADTALTSYKVLARGEGHTLVEASPITGRTHQLRVHFASLGHPITGDDLYGTPSDLISRHALHACKLRFPHPTEAAVLTVTAPLTDDLTHLINRFFPQFLKDNKIGKAECSIEKR